MQLTVGPGIHFQLNLHVITLSLLCTIPRFVGYDKQPLFNTRILVFARTESDVLQIPLWTIHKNVAKHHDSKHKNSP